MTDAEKKDVDALKRIGLGDDEASQVSRQSRATAIQQMMQLAHTTQDQSLPNREVIAQDLSADGAKRQQKEQSLIAYMRASGDTADVSSLRNAEWSDDAIEELKKQKRQSLVERYESLTDAEKKDVDALKRIGVSDQDAPQLVRTKQYQDLSADDKKKVAALKRIGLEDDDAHRVVVYNTAHLKTDGTHATVKGLERFTWHDGSSGEGSDDDRQGGYELSADDMVRQGTSGLFSTVSNAEFERMQRMVSRRNRQVQVLNEVSLSIADMMSSVLEDLTSTRLSTNAYRLISQMASYANFADQRAIGAMFSALSDLARLKNTQGAQRLLSGTMGLTSATASMAAGYAQKKAQQKRQEATEKRAANDQDTHTPDTDQGKSDPRISGYDSKSKARQLDRDARNWEVLADFLTLSSATVGMSLAEMGAAIKGLTIKEQSEVGVQNSIWDGSVSTNIGSDPSEFQRDKFVSPTPLGDVTSQVPSPSTPNASTWFTFGDTSQLEMAQLISAVYQHQYTAQSDVYRNVGTATTAVARQFKAEIDKRFQTQVTMQVKKWMERKIETKKRRIAETKDDELEALGETAIQTLGLEAIQEPDIHRKAVFNVDEAQQTVDPTLKETPQVTWGAATREGGKGWWRYASSWLPNKERAISTIWMGDINDANTIEKQTERDKETARWIEELKQADPNSDQRKEMAQQIGAAMRRKAIDQLAKKDQQTERTWAGTGSQEGFEDWKNVNRYSQTDAIKKGYRGNAYDAQRLMALEETLDTQKIDDKIQSLEQQIAVLTQWGKAEEAKALEAKKASLKASLEALKGPTLVGVRTRIKDLRARIAYDKKDGITKQQIHEELKTLEGIVTTTIL
ncbi:hypothetical protein EBZ35_07010, partial [bacterium]|nr:hypothetical protein [bacterium]